MSHSGGETIPDIKEKQPIKAAIKKKVTAPPKELAHRGARQLRQEVKEAAQQGATPANESQQYDSKLSINVPHSATQQITKRAINRRHGPKEKPASDQEPTKARTPGGQAAASKTAPQSSQYHAVEQGRASVKEQAVCKAAEQKRISSQQSPSTGNTGHLQRQPRQHTIQRRTDPKEVHRTVRPKTKANVRPQSVKESSRSIKTAKAPVKSTAKTTPHKAAGNAHRAAGKAGRDSVQMMQKSAVKATQKALKAIRAGAKSLMAALGAGGAAVVMIVILLCLIGGLLASPFGIFFSGEGEGEQTVQSILAQLNTEFAVKITEIEKSVPHDDVQQTGTRVSQKNVLAVYAVKVTTDPDDPLDAVTMDDRRAEILQRIFWDMNQISHGAEVYTEEETVTVTDDEGNETEEPQTIERTRLIITISGKTAEQMAQKYGFTGEQLDYLAELLSDDYEELWYGLPSGGGSDDIVAVALSQVGNVGGQPYWSWYGYPSRVAWCACFVSWCGDQCGYIENGIMPKFSNCDTGIGWFKARGQWQGRSDIPEPGMLIFFDWNGNGESDHVGIVESSDGATVYTVEGNANDACKRLGYVVGDYRIIGYGKLCR